MRKVLIIGALALLCLAIAFATTGSVTLLFAATIVAMVVAVALAVKTSVDSSSKVVTVTMMAALAALCVTSFTALKWSERAELVSAKQQVIAAYEPELSVDDIQAYCNDQCFAYAILESSRETSGVDMLEWITSDSKPGQRRDISNDRVFASHVLTAIAYNNRANITLFLGVIVRVVQAAILRRGCRYA
jgi:hypothetical protein